MGFWQGVAEAYKDISAEQARKKEIKEEREYRTKEKEADRAFDREQLMKKVVEDRRNNLLNLLAKRRATEGDSSTLANKARALASRIGSEDDPRLKKIMADPLLAATMYDSITALDATRAKNDQRMLSGTELLDAVSYFAEDGTPKVTPGKSFGLDDLDRLSADPEAYEKAVLDLSPTSKRAEPVIAINQDAFRPRRYEQEKQATDYFNGMVLGAASKYVESLGRDASSYSDMKAIIEDAQKNPDGAGMAQLYTQFGPDVYTNFKKIAGAETEEFLLRNPIISSHLETFKKDIVTAGGGDTETIQRQEDIKYLQGVLDNPASSESDKVRAKRALDQLTGQF